ncbi:dihydrofolate reductase [Sediminihabitans luteus]|uniref:Dihydrofolate reductase n=1 Tax=Sediminihabitans luteus TaxID=1138585 RepID=A0A2M9D158_9CELL|nr:dihydrofolate reductase family protein [Sediminihabitans luteus]PJJ77909.1 dihydrofolate reductase [Sediminihabitans luteus]
MALVYTALCSLDGYVVDADGSFDWAQPSPEVHRAVNAIERRASTIVLGRRTYEVLTVWDDPAAVFGELPPEIAEYAEVWAGIDKVVVSSTLAEVSTARTRLVRTLAADDVRDLVASARGDVSIGGPTTAAPFLRAGLVEAIDLFVSPVVVGGGTRALPDGARLDLTLTRTHAFADGTVHLAYARR